MPRDPARASGLQMPDRVRNLLGSDEYARACDLMARGRPDAASAYVNDVLETNDLFVPEIAVLRPMRAPDGRATR